MLKTTDTVALIIREDETALESLRRGFLNLSAYADEIVSEVEKRTKKNVRKGTIVVALSRLTSELQKAKPLRPLVSIESLSIEASLSEITFEKTQGIQRAVESAHTNLEEKDGFCTLTSGVNEITIICSKKNYAKIKKIKAKPKGEYHNLAAINVRFKESEYLEIPNMIYSLVSTIASRRINLIEIVSTYSEISFIFREKDLQASVDALQKHLHNS